MITVSLNAVGLVAPGLTGWQASRPTLRGEQPWQHQPLERYKPTRLPRNEARRATDLVRLAFHICEDLAEQTSMDLSECSTVFSSSGGDYPVVDHICRALTEPGKPVSPTQFHNSVHNAAAGYWSIAIGSQAASNSLSAYDDSFQAGLLEAMVQCSQEQQPVLFACYDIRPPEPLQSKRPITESFGCALLLTPQPDDRTLAALTLHPDDTVDNSPPQQQDLGALWQANPAARSLPLLELLARHEAGEVTLKAEQGPGLRLEIQPCR